MVLRPNDWKIQLKEINTTTAITLEEEEGDASKNPDENVHYRGDDALNVITATSIETKLDFGLNPRTKKNTSCHLTYQLDSFQVVYARHCEVISI